MAQAFSNLSVSFPLCSSNKATNLCRLLPGNLNSCKKNIITAMAAGESRDNLDHLQRVTKQQNGSQSNNKRFGPVTPVGLWDRFPTARTVNQMIETMERIMEEPFAYSGAWPSPLPTEIGSYSRGRTPWEIKEGGGEYKMRFDMPGMSKDDVKVWVEDKMLVVKAEKKLKKNINDGNGEVGEDDEWSAKSYGKYSSRIALPENVVFDQIKAEVKDGVLYIIIPKGGHNGRILDINVQ